MRRIGQSIVLAVALAGSVGCAARVRVYDEPHRDYHRWDRREEASFRVYLTERRRPYVEFRTLSPAEQNEYWVWRHGHPDRR